MTFPVLAAHQIYPLFFQLSGQLTPSSIRDQMVRGQMLVEQAWEAGVLSGASAQVTEARPLLVVGAGAAGATVALSAARLGVPTWLVEWQDKPFKLQASCGTRWIDPCQYDWPFDHWDMAKHPWRPDGPPSPLPWQANLANLLVQQWERELIQAAPPAGKHHSLRLLYGIKAMEPDSSNDAFAGGWRMRFEINQQSPQGTLASLPQSFGMVVWTVGLGQETHMIRPDRAQPPSFSGFPFWATDHYGKSNYGLPPGVTPRVVISGAGDGGLQDFLRIMTRYKSAGEIVQALPLSDAVLRRLQSAENEAQRAYHWGSNGIYDHHVLRTLHYAHLDLAQQLASQQAMRHYLQRVLRDDTPRTIHLVHSCDHFSNVYALNRFLVLLIAAYLNREDLILSGKRTLNVVATGAHRCRVDQDGHGHALCHGEDHVVHLVDAPQCTATSRRDTEPSQSISANIIIVRHGIARLQTQLADVSMPRQLPPHHVYGEGMG